MFTRLHPRQRLLFVFFLASVVIGTTAFGIWNIFSPSNGQSEALAYTPPTGIYTDAYTYEDGFSNPTAGINTSASPGALFTTAGQITADLQNTVITSQCITLPQPSGATFSGWLFSDIDMSNTTNLASAQLKIQDCGGTDLQTSNVTTTAGVKSVDISGISTAQSSVRLQLLFNHNTGTKGSILNYWKINGKSTGATDITITPATSTVNVGSEIIFTINYSSNGAITKSPKVIVDLEKINGLATPTVDDGLAEDAEEDHGSGVKPQRPIQFVRASNATGSIVPTTPAANATSGQVVWNLPDIADGTSDSVTVTFKVPTGYVDQKKVAAAVTLQFGDEETTNITTLSARQEITKNSANVTAIGLWTPRIEEHFWQNQIGPSATNFEARMRFLNTYSTPSGTNPQTSDIPEVNITVNMNQGQCIPVYRGMNPAYTPFFTVISQPTLGIPVDGPLVLKLEKHTIDWRVFSAYIDIAGGSGNCTSGNVVTFDMTAQSTLPANFTVSNSKNMTIQVITTRNGGGNIYKVQDENTNTVLNNIFGWPGHGDGIVSDFGSVTAGQYFSIWGPYNDIPVHTVTLDYSYNVMRIPANTTFHGVVDDGRVDNFYKDITGTALDPSNPSFTHGNPVASGWTLIDKTNVAVPYTSTNPANANGIVVGDGVARILMVKTADEPREIAPRNGKFNPVTMFRMCDGTIMGCGELADGTNLVINISTTSSYYSGVWYTGEVHNRNLVKHNNLSRPEIRVAPVQTGYPAGSVAQFRLIPGNANSASKSTDGRWGINLYNTREYIDLTGLTSQIINPTFGPNGINTAAIIFRAPNPATCLASTDSTSTDCLAWWEVPQSSQPQNGWGFRTSDWMHDQYGLMYSFQLNAPIKTTTPAGTVLNVTAESRAYNTSTGLPTTLGANNAAPTNRWAATNYSALGSAQVTENPAITASKTAPTSKDINQIVTYNLSATNIGNAPNNGIYLVDLLPKTGVNGSQFTPNYDKIYISLATVDGKAEYSNDTTCFTSSLAATWVDMPLTASSSRAGFTSETTNMVPASANCIRIRRNPSSTLNINPGSGIQALLDVVIPNNVTLRGQRIFNKALGGASPTLGSSSTGTVSPVETVNRETLISNDISVAVNKKFETDPNNPNYIKWILEYRNTSGSVATNINLSDSIPNQVVFENPSFDATTLSARVALNSRLSCNNVGCTPTAVGGNGEGGNLAFTISQLDPDDGTPGSGLDEGVVYFWTRVLDPQNTTSVANSATITPSSGTGGTSTSTLNQPNITITKSEVPTPNRGGNGTQLTPHIINPNDQLVYTITATNNDTTSQYFRIVDQLPAYFTPTGITINGANASLSLIDGSGVLRYNQPTSTAQNSNVTIVITGNADSNSKGVLLQNTAFITPCQNSTGTLCGFSEKTNTVFAQVNPNNAPVATNSVFIVNKDSSNNVYDLQPHITDTENDANLSTLTINSTSTNGTLLNQGNGTVRYTPNSGYVGTDSFTYVVCDQTALCDNSTTVSIYVNPVESVAITKVANKTQANSGEQVTYTLSYQNNGPAVQNGIITDTLPTGATFVSCSNSCNSTNLPIITWSVGNLANAASGSVTLTSTVAENKDAVITNSASLSCQILVWSETTPNVATQILQNCTAQNATASTTITAPTLLITKTVNGTVFNPNQTATYTIEITNSGNGPATNVSISDTIPTGLTYVANSCSNSCNQTGSTLSWNVGTLAASQVTSVTFQASVNSNATGTITNSASVVSTEISTPVSDTVDISTNNSPTAVNDSVSTNQDQSVVVTVPTNDTDPNNNIDPSSVTITSTPAHGTATLVPGSGLTPPATIRVVRTGYLDCNAWVAAGQPVVQVDTIPFDEYVKNVLPNEWISSWPADSLKAGAMAVKMYAWHKQSISWRGYLGGDVVDNTCDQYYVPNSANANTNAAVDATWNFTFTRNNNLFFFNYVDTDAHCASWLPGQPCMGQYGSRDKALQGFTWQQILQSYYNPIQIGSTGSATGQITYTPTNGFSGNDSFTYQICDTTGLCSSATVSVTILSNPNLTIQKAVSPTTIVNRSDTLTYTLTFENTGQQPSTNTIIQDDFDETKVDYTSCDVSLITGAISSATCSQNAGIVTFNIGTVPANSGVLTVRFTTTIKNNAVGTITNTGTIDSNETSLTASNQVQNTIAVPQLTLQKTVSTDGTTFVENVSPNRGDAVTFRLQIANPSTNADVTNVSVSDIVPTGLTYVANSCTNSCNASSVPTIQWTIPTILAGQTVTITFQATVDANAAQGMITNTANATTSSVGVPAVQDQATVTVGAVPTVDLVLTNSNGITSKAPNTTSVYVLTVQNTGNTTATGITLTETVPVGTTFVASQSTAGWSCSDGAVGGTSCTLSVASLANGATQTFNFAVSIPASIDRNQAEISNVASIQTSMTNPTETLLTNNSVTDTDTIAFDPTQVVTLNKTANVSTAKPGDTATFVLTYQNPNNWIVTNAIMTDPIGAGWEYVSGSCSNSCVYDSTSKTLTWNLGALNANQSGSVSFQAKIASTVTATQLSNTATVDITETQPTNATVTITVQQQTAPVITPPAELIRTGGIVGISFGAFVMFLATLIFVARKRRITEISHPYHF